MLTWEYPPRIIGGIARHVEGLAGELAKRNEVHVVTLDFPGSPSHEQSGQLHIHRVPVELPSPTFHTWVLMFNHFFEKRVGQLAHAYGYPDVIHVQNDCLGAGLLERARIAAAITPTPMAMSIRGHQFDMSA